MRVGDAFAYRRRWLQREITERHRPSSQSNEADILDRLIRETAPAATFVEFGFGPQEFNCCRLPWQGFQGLLIDGSPHAVDQANRRLPRSVRAVQRFLTADNLEVVTGRFDRIGVLSVDVDGNDYWMLERLLPARPDVVVVEYNAVFGLRPITVPYRPDFERFKAHPSGFYHGASLEALTRLCNRHSYGLAAVSASGVNAFYVRDQAGEPAAELFRECVPTSRWHGRGEAEWPLVSELPYVTV